LSNQFQFAIFYAEFQAAARLETSIQHKAALLVELNQVITLLKGYRLRETAKLR